MPTDKCQKKSCPSYGRYCRAIGHDKPDGKKKTEPEKPTSKPGPKKIRSVSKKTARKMGKYSREKKRLQQSETNQVCAVALLKNKSAEVIEVFKNCQFHANQFHHPEGRTGDKLIPTEDGKFLCGNCHRILEEKAELAKELGLSVSRMKHSEKRKHLYPST
jgi:hypothetical protein